MKTQRRYDIDWLRVIAIGLLLIYHIAIVFQPWAMFLGFIRSENSWEGLWKPMNMLNVWRIPFLFFVSGMGVYFAMKKRTWKQLVWERSKRILLPFLFGIVAITPLHMYIFQSFYKISLNYFPHMGHLWFLGNIFCYVLLLMPLFFLLRKLENGTFQKVLSKVMNHPLGPLSIALFFMLETYILQPQPFAMYAQTWHGFFLGLLAFLFGFMFMYSGTSFWKTVLQWKWGYFGLAAILYAIRYSVFATEAPGYLMSLESISWILWVFGMGYGYLNKPSKTLIYLSQAAYPVYIVHMFALYLGALLILPLDIPVSAKFIIITIFTMAVCFLIFEFLIRRIPFVGPLFGLKWDMRPNPNKKLPEIQNTFDNENLKTGNESLS
ncbi:acyltransferase family protein [Maribacter aurantiacus]|uniref:Acyltransferase n=1 Tax=Maribacter aurantiacus TaxID=1882343 RepID=A0A5R8MBV2_9FLAO|nr:acyltransferase family protein [Maribacter aurantiacus]TLF47005.1 acyltransferase [Maribacter aurantiacus]